jgi:hypothetical protein
VKHLTAILITGLWHITMLQDINSYLASTAKFRMKFLLLLHSPLLGTWSRLGTQNSFTNLFNRAGVEFLIQATLPSWHFTKTTEEVEAAQQVCRVDELTLADSKEQFKLHHPSDYWRVHALLQSIPPFYERKIEQDNSCFFCKRTKEAFCMLLCQYRVYWLASLDWRWLSHFINLHLWPTKDVSALNWWNLLNYERKTKKETRKRCSTLHDLWPQFHPSSTTANCVCLDDLNLLASTKS